MTPRPRSLSLPLLLALTAPASAQLDVGTEAPVPSPSAWLNRESVNLESLRGRVVAYAFVRLEDDECLFWLEEWDALRDRFALDPVTFLAITNESPAYIRETCETEGIDTPFLVDPADEAAKAFQIQLHPAVAIVAPNGTVALMAQPGTTQELTDAIVEHLDDARAFPELGRGARGVDRHLEKRDLKKALDQIERTLPRLKEDDPDRQRLEDLPVLVAELTDRLNRTAEAAIEAEDWPRAVTALTRLAQEHEGLEGAEGAAERIEELHAAEERAREITAAIEFARADRYERERNWRAAHRAYETLAKVHPETQAGRRAADRAVLLEHRAR